MKNDYKIEIKQVDNGYIIESNYSCYGGELTKVFDSWYKAVQWIEIALRVETQSKDGEGK